MFLTLPLLAQTVTEVKPTSSTNQKVEEAGQESSQVDQIEQPDNLIELKPKIDTLDYKTACILFTESAKNYLIVNKGENFFSEILNDADKNILQTIVDLNENNLNSVITKKNNNLNIPIFPDDLKYIKKRGIINVFYRDIKNYTLKLLAEVSVYFEPGSAFDPDKIARGATKNPASEQEMMEYIEKRSKDHEAIREFSKRAGPAIEKMLAAVKADDKEEFRNLQKNFTPEERKELAEAFKSIVVFAEEKAKIRVTEFLATDFSDYKEQTPPVCAFFIEKYKE